MLNLEIFLLMFTVIFSKITVLFGTMRILISNLMKKISVTFLTMFFYMFYVLHLIIQYTQLKITKKIEKSSWQINLIMIIYILLIQKVSKDNDIRIEEAISVKDKY